ncbi:MarR family transcriptional regulator [Bifidobacterium callitrichos]|nr:MarR family transcriptional regulator [Bifidobacterium callitrichos]
MVFLISRAGTPAFFQEDRRIETAIRAMGLLPGQPKILECLGERDGRTAKEICAECILDKSTMTGLLARMERRGLIRREANEEDRRSYRVFLTDLGREQLKHVTAITSGSDATATQGMSDEER